MRPCNDKIFFANLKAGDIGLILADNFFSTMQNWYRLKVEKAPLRASHAFLMTTPPTIAEANGLYISNDASIGKFVGDKTKCWVYRYMSATPDQKRDLMNYCNWAVQAGGTYGVSDILQFGANYCLSFIGKRVKWKDNHGEFCSEFCLHGMDDVGWPTPITDDQPIESWSPSLFRSWLELKGSQFDYQMIGSYDPDNGGYAIL